MILSRSLVRIAAATAVLALVAGAGSCSKKQKEQRPAIPPPAASPTGENAQIESYGMLADVPLRSLDGGEYHLSNFQGNIVVLCVFATWNKDCLAEIPILNTLHGKIKSMRMTVLGVAIDDGGAKALETFLEKQPVSFPVFYNGAAIANDLGGIRKLPTTFILLRDGHIYDKALGTKPLRYFDDRIRLIRAQRL